MKVQPASLSGYDTNANLWKGWKGHKFQCSKCVRQFTDACSLKECSIGLGRDESKDVAVLESPFH